MVSHALQEELRQASQIVTEAVVSSRTEQKPQPIIDSADLPALTVPDNSEGLQEVEEVPVVAPAVSKPDKPVVETAKKPQPEPAKRASVSPPAVGAEAKKPAKEPAAPTEVVIPFARRPPFVSGPFKERVKVPSIKLVPVTDSSKPSGESCFPNAALGLANSICMPVTNTSMHPPIQAELSI